MSRFSQHLETNRLLGVDFVPTRPGSVRAAASQPSPPEIVVTHRGPPPAIFPSADTVSLSVKQKSAALETLRKRHDEMCPHCTTATAHTRTVFGETNPDADLMFIGEAPGREEDRTGRPFVGRAGRKLDEMIAAMGLERADVYIANILKSRPLDNRTPLPDEIERCSPFLEEQVEIIRPRVIVTLGGPSSKFLLKTTEGITRIRGRWARYDALGMSIPVMPTFHPAYLLRNYTLETRGKVWADMQAVMQALSSGR